jgi:hypothetical protein
MAINTLFAVLTYLNSTYKGNSTILIDAYIAKALAKACVGRGIPYPIQKDTEYLIPGGGKLGRNSSYYIKTYSDQDLPYLLDVLF